MKICLLALLVVGFAAAVPAIQTNNNVDEPIVHIENHDVIDDITNGKIKSNIDNSLWCPICEYLVREGEDFITKNSTEEEATNFLKNACHHLPKEKQDSCEQFIENNYDNLFQHIIAKESAPVVCSQLHVCKDIENAEIDECTFCKYAAHRVENFMHSNRTLLDIIEYGENFCQNIGHPYDTHCVNIMPIYYSEIVGKLIDRNNFADACSTMHFCDMDHTAMEHLDMDDHHDEHNDEHHDDRNDEEEEDDEHHTISDILKKVYQ